MFQLKTSMLLFYNRTKNPFITTKDCFLDFVRIFTSVRYSFPLARIASSKRSVRGEARMGHVSSNFHPLHSLHNLGTHQSKISDAVGTQ